MVISLMIAYLPIKVIIHVTTIMILTLTDYSKSMARLQRMYVEVSNSQLMMAQKILTYTQEI